LSNTHGGGGGGYSALRDVSGTSTNFVNPIGIADNDYAAIFTHGGGDGSPGDASDYSSYESSSEEDEKLETRVKEVNS
jgi:hypothetical protein